MLLRKIARLLAYEREPINSKPAYLLILLVNAVFYSYLIVWAGYLNYMHLALEKNATIMADFIVYLWMEPPIDAWTSINLQFF